MGACQGQRAGRAISTVSEMTIRRDLDMLAEQGIVQRIRGGAVAIGPQPFAARFGRHARAKDRIATKLVDLVGDGGAIGIDASSTLQRLAGYLGQVRELTVVTNGPDTFFALQDRRRVSRPCSQEVSSTRAQEAWSGPLAHAHGARGVAAPLVRFGGRAPSAARHVRSVAGGRRSQTGPGRRRRRSRRRGRLEQARPECTGPRLFARSGRRSS